MYDDLVILGVPRAVPKSKMCNHLPLLWHYTHKRGWPGEASVHRVHNQIKPPPQKHPTIVPVNMKTSRRGTTGTALSTTSLQLVSGAAVDPMASVSAPEGGEGDVITNQSSQTELDGGADRAARKLYLVRFPLLIDLPAWARVGTEVLKRHDCRGQYQHLLVLVGSQGYKAHTTILDEHRDFMFMQKVLYCIPSEGILRAPWCARSSSVRAEVL